MTNYNGPIYETTFVVMGDVRDEFDDWLQDVRTHALLEAEIHELRNLPLASEASEEATPLLSEVPAVRAVDRDG